MHFIFYHFEKQFFIKEKLYFLQYIVKINAINIYIVQFI